MTALAVAALVALPLSACGSEDGDAADDKKASAPATPAFAKKSAVEIVTTAFDAMQNIGAVHLSGNMIQDGQRMDLDVRTEGTGNCAGTLTQKGATARFVSTKDATYLKANDAFWKENAGADAAAAISYLNGRWAKLDAAKEFADLCNVAELLSAAGDDAGPDKIDKSATVSDVQQFAGHDVVEVSASQGKEKFRMLVEVDGEHRLLRLSSDTPGDPGELVFDFDEKIDVRVPGPKESVAFGG